MFLYLVYVLALQSDSGSLALSHLEIARTSLATGMELRLAASPVQSSYV